MSTVPDLLSLPTEVLQDVFDRVGQDADESDFKAYMTLCKRLHPIVHNAWLSNTCLDADFDSESAHLLDRLQVMPDTRLLRRINDVCFRDCYCDSDATPETPKVCSGEHLEQVRWLAARVNPRWMGVFIHRPGSFLGAITESLHPNRLVEVFFSDLDLGSDPIFNFLRKTASTLRTMEVQDLTDSAAELPQTGTALLLPHLTKLSVERLHCPCRAEAEKEDGWTEGKIEETNSGDSEHGADMADRRDSGSLLLRLLAAMPRLQHLELSGDGEDAGCERHHLQARVWPITKLTIAHICDGDSCREHHRPDGAVKPEQYLPFLETLEIPYFGVEAIRYMPAHLKMLKLGAASTESLQALGEWIAEIGPRRCLRTIILEERKFWPDGFILTESEEARFVASFGQSGVELTA